MNAPLTPAVFHILLALSGGEKHGYAIMKEVETDSHGLVKMGPGTLYGSLKRMLEAGLITESENRVDPEMTETEPSRRVYYRISGEGEKALSAELDRYRHIADLTQKHELLPKTFSYGR